MVAVLALVAGIFAVVNLTAGGQSGAASPEDATRSFFDAASDEDLVGMLEMLDPAERDVMLDLVRQLESELSRLGITENMDLRNVPGFDLEIEGLQVSTTELGPGVTEVALTGGAVAYKTEPESVPIGDVLRDLIEADGGEVDIREDGGQTRIEEESEEAFLVATESNGRWHLSLAFTIAEYARRDAGLRLPDFNGGVTPQGAASAEDAVRQLVDAAAALDVGRTIALLPPDQMRALQVYAPLFLDDARQSAADLRAEEGFEMQIEGLELDTSSVQGGTRVVPTAATVTVTTYDGTSTFSWADSCIEVSGYLAEDFEEDFGDTTACFDDVVDDMGSELSDDAEEELRELFSLFEEFQPGVVVVERDGGFYVDPLRTYSDVMFQMFEDVERADLEEGGILYRLFAGELTLLDEWDSWEAEDCWGDYEEDPYGDYDDYDDDYLYEDC